MAKTKYVIELDDEQRKLLTEIVAEGTESARTIMRAKILLLSDITRNKRMPVDAVAEHLGTTHTTVQTVRASFGKDGLEAALYRKKRVVNIVNCRINRDVREQILRLSEEEPPKGHKHWSLRLLCKEAVHRGIIDKICPATMSEILKKK